MTTTVIDPASQYYRGKKMVLFHDRVQRQKQVCRQTFFINNIQNLIIFKFKKIIYLFKIKLFISFFSESTGIKLDIVSSAPNAY